MRGGCVAGEKIQNRVSKFTGEVQASDIKVRSCRTRPGVLLTVCCRLNKLRHRETILLVWKAISLLNGTFF